MHCETKILDDLYYVGSSDRRLALFENVYPIPNGVSYNSYLYLDEKTALLDTVDASALDVFLENVDSLLKGRKLDYLIVDHMEPDHSACIAELCLRHIDMSIVTNAMGKKFLLNFFPDIKNEILIVKEGDRLNIGRHTFSFVMAPMVHWPEVMFTFEHSNGVLFSADAFGTFGAIDGDLFIDSNELSPSYISEARRYYANIVGKYGDQVNIALKKASSLDIKMICPLHGPIYRKGITRIVDLYKKWASYEAEDNDGVLLCYGSIYGNTKNAVDVLSNMLMNKGVKNIATYDVSKTDQSILIGETFRVKTIILASVTYNAGAFVKMEEFLHDLAAHKIRNKTFGFIENGSWAPMAKNAMKAITKDLEGCSFLQNSLTIVSKLKESQLNELEKMADEIVSSI